MKLLQPLVLLTVLAPGAILLMASGPAEIGQDSRASLSSETTIVSEQTTNQPESDPQPTRPSASSRYGWLFFPALIIFYFALQMWILPKMGVST